MIISLKDFCLWYNRERIRLKDYSDEFLQEMIDLATDNQFPATITIDMVKAFLKL